MNLNWTGVAGSHDMEAIKKILILLLKNILINKNNSEIKPKDSMRLSVQHSSNTAAGP